MKLLVKLLPSLVLWGFLIGVGLLAWKNEYFWTIVSKGDNIPIAGMIPIVGFFTWIAIKEAMKHDRLIREGRRDEVLDEMRK